METTPYLSDLKEVWEIVKVDEKEIERIATLFKLPPLLAKIIISRNLHEDLDYLNQFLYPSLDLIKRYDKISLPDEIKRAKERIHRAIKKKEHIVINGDSDADGITATAILVSGLRRLGARVSYDFPVRSIEGHGIQPRIIEEAAYKKKAKLIISADCGTKNIDTVAYARKHGVDVIICDHHVIGKELPAAHAIINPYLIINNKEFNRLSGAAVAYKLVLAVFDIFKQDIPKRLNNYLLAIASLGTLSDRMSLLDPMNRIMVKKGVEFLNLSNMEGLRALLDVSAGHLITVKPRDISRTIVPRLNAPGRIGNPAEGIPDSNMVVDLLLLGTGIENASKAENLIGKLRQVFTMDQSLKNKVPTDSIDPYNDATIVDDVNERRKRITSKIEDEIEHLIQDQVDPEKDRVIIIEGHNWNSGVIGIDTDRLKERFLRPAIIITSVDNDVYCRGSVRSVPTIDIYEIIDKISEDFENETGKPLFQMEVKTESGSQVINAFGGHAQACGFSLHKDLIPEFKKRIQNEFSKLSQEKFKFTYEVIESLSFAQINTSFIKTLEQLAPFGQHFEFPIFLLKNCRLGKSVKPFGNKYQKNRTPHVDFTILYKNRRGITEKLFAVGFGLYEKYLKVLTNDADSKYELIFTIENVIKRKGRKKRTKLRLNVLDIRKVT